MQTSESVHCRVPMFLQQETVKLGFPCSQIPVLHSSEHHPELSVEQPVHDTSTIFLPLATYRTIVVSL